jgi:hypothetical protein
VWRRALIGVGLAAVVWMYGVYVAPGGGLDGPCAFSTDEFGQGAREGSSITSEWSWLPPQELCIEERPSGAKREEAYPGPLTFAVAGVAFLLPLILRRPRRARPASRPVSTS